MNEVGLQMAQLKRNDCGGGGGGGSGGSGRSGGSGGGGSGGGSGGSGSGGGSGGSGGGSGCGKAAVAVVAAAVAALVVSSQAEPSLTMNQSDFEGGSTARKEEGSERSTSAVPSARSKSRVVVEVKTRIEPKTFVGRFCVYTMAGGCGHFCCY